MTVSVGDFYEKNNDLSPEKNLARIFDVYSFAPGPDWQADLSYGISV